jgi:hypothetical protein
VDVRRPAIDQERKPEREIQRSHQRKDNNNTLGLLIHESHTPRAIRGSRAMEDFSSDSIILREIISHQR